MSGGHFDYLQYRIQEIEDSIDSLINSNEDGTLNEWNEPIGNFYSPETILEFKKAVEYCKLARIYAQRIDWLVSGDDGEETFHKRLAEDLNNETNPKKVNSTPL